MIQTFIVSGVILIFLYVIYDILFSDNIQYTLLKASPEIERKEKIAIKFCIILLIIFTALFFTSFI